VNKDEYITHHRTLCTGSRGGGGDERARSALRNTDDNDDEDADADADVDGLYNVREHQRRPSQSSLDDAMSDQSEREVFGDVAHHGDAMSGRSVAVIPATIPGARPARPHGTSSISSGTGRPSFAGASTLFSNTGDLAHQ